MLSCAWSSSNVLHLSDTLLLTLLITLNLLVFNKVFFIFLFIIIIVQFFLILLLACIVALIHSLLIESLKFLFLYLVLFLLTVICKYEILSKTLRIQSTLFSTSTMLILTAIDWGIIIVKSFTLILLVRVITLH